MREINKQVIKNIIPAQVSSWASWTTTSLPNWGIFRCESIVEKAMKGGGVSDHTQRVF